MQLNWIILSTVEWGSTSFLLLAAGEEQVISRSSRNTSRHSMVKIASLHTFQTKHYENSKETNENGGKLVSAVPLWRQSKDLYYNLLRSSRFAGAPRGDNLYSYRFSEILSAGAIPVVYADGWVLPYSADVVNWDDISVLIPQQKVNQTIDILNNYSQDRICKMQKKALQFYNEYVKDSHGRLRGILKVLEGRSRRDIEFGTAPE